MRRRRDDGNEKAIKRHEYVIARTKEWWVEFCPANISSVAREAATRYLARIQRQYRAECGR